MGKVNRPLWLEGLAKRRDEVAKKESEGKAWERGAVKRLVEVADACRFYGFQVECIDQLTIAVTPEPLYNEMVNVDASTIRIVKPPTRNWTLDPDYAVEVTPAPSIIRMVEKVGDYYDDPPMDDEEPVMVPEPPDVVYLDSKEVSHYRSVREKLEGALTDIVERLIDLKHPELLLKKED
jgi:hypothetical protein